MRRKQELACAAVLVALGCDAPREQTDQAPTPAQRASPAPSAAPAPAPQRAAAPSTRPPALTVPGAVPLSASVLGARPAPFGSVFAGLADDATIDDARARAPSTTDLTEAADARAARARIRSEQVARQAVGRGDAVADLLQGLGVARRDLDGPRDPAGLRNDGVYAATGLEDIVVQLKWHDQAIALGYFMQMSDATLVARAWRGASIGANTWMGDAWRAALHRADDTAGWPGWVEVRLTPAMPLARSLPMLANQLGRVPTAVQLPGVVVELESDDDSRLEAEDGTTTIASLASSLPPSDVCETGGELLLALTAGKVARVDVEVCITDAPSRKRAFATMERVWGRAKVERTDAGQLALTFRRRGLVVMVANQEEADLDASAAFRLTMTRR